eukprot:2735972-Pyramimonas_sp.AAC.1
MSYRASYRVRESPRPPCPGPLAVPRCTPVLRTDTKYLLGISFEGNLDALGGIPYLYVPHRWIPVSVYYATPFVLRQ